MSAKYDQLRKCYSDRGYVLSKLSSGYGLYQQHEWNLYHATSVPRVDLYQVTHFASLAAANAAINAGTYDRNPNRS